MLPVQQELLNMVLMLLFTMMGSAAIAAYIFREVRSWWLVIGSFAVGIVFIFAAQAVTGALGAFFVSAAFGASMGAMIGGTMVALTEGHPRAGQAVAVTFGIVALITVIAAGIGLFSGYDFSGWRGTMFIILLGILGISLLGFAVRYSKVVETVMSLGIIGFFSVYLVVDFNQIKDTVEVASWQEALNIAMSIFLDILNILIRLLPIILDAMD